MLTKRIIPCLDIKDGKTVKGVNFVGLRDAGDPVELAERYAREGADELVFLDISATAEGRNTFVPLVEKIARNINIPFTVGGGIRSVEDADVVIKAGADKVSINSAAVLRPDLINELSSKFGSQAVVVAIDAKLVKAEWKVFLVGGTQETELNLFDWALACQERGAGEILFTSMSNDGTKAGFANRTLKELTSRLTIPVIASGGAGSIGDFIKVFKDGKADAALAASVFHFNEIEIPKLKQELKDNEIEIRL